MIDQDLSQELHSLAETVNEPFDLTALHRRISAQSRRRSAVKAGCAGAGVVAVVGGLFVVQERPGPAGSGLAAASSLASSPSQQPALPACDVVLAGLRAASVSTPDPVDSKDVTKDPSGLASGAPARGFKGIVTILTIDGPQLTFRVDEPYAATPTEGAGTVDAETEWVDGQTQLDSPPTLEVGEQLGLATKQGSDGVDHAVFIDIGATASSADHVDENPATALDKKLQAADESNPSATTDSTVVAGAILPPGPTEKSPGTITTVDAASITVTLDDQSAQARTVVVDLATAQFYAGDSVCVPGSLTVGEKVGVAFHSDDAGNLIGDAAMLVP
jgi:hypothetical protein